MSDLERQIRRQTEAGYERLRPVEDLLPPDMAETFGIERTPTATTTLIPRPERRSGRAWVVATATFAAVLLIGIPTVLQMTKPEPNVVAPPDVVTPTTLEPPRPGMIQNLDNGHFYQAIISDTALDWADLRTEAESQSFRGVSGHLATITTETEDLFIREAFPQQITEGTWLGGFQPEGSQEPAGGWQWVTGEPFDYANWGDGEPNDDGGEGCMQYVPNPPRWNDTSCGTAGLYILEYDTTDS